MRIRVYKDGIPRVKTIAEAKDTEWNEDTKRVRPRSRKDYHQVNDIIDEQWSKYKKRFKSLNESGKHWRAEDVFREDVAIVTPMFQENALEYLKTLLNPNSYASAHSRYQKILRYTKEQDFSLDEITDKWLHGFRVHCRTKEKNNKGETGNGDNTINLAIKFIKRVASFAEVGSKALKKTKISFKEAALEYPTIADFNKIWELNLVEGSQVWHARNFFSLQIFFRGMRSGDLQQLEWSDIQGERLKYDSGKTSESYDMEILPRARLILDSYKNIQRKYIFPYFTWYHRDDFTDQENLKAKKRKIDAGTSNVNNGLKKIGKAAKLTVKLSTHKARHMFAIWADEMLNGDIGIIQKMLGHGSRAMTERYIKRLRKSKDLDTAASTVLSNI